MQTPITEVGKNIHKHDPKLMRRLGRKLSSMIEAGTGGEVALSDLQVARLSLQALCETEWHRCHLLTSLKDFREKRTNK